jgi:hypothetical protein
VYAELEASMINLRVPVLLACAALLAFGLSASQAQARQGGFFFAPFFAPSPWPYYEPRWRRRYYAPPRRRYYAPPRKRKAVASTQRKQIQTRRKSKAALAIPPETTRPQPVGCDRAETIVAEFGFKNIKAEACTGPIFDFSATRDGKPFSIQIVAASGELAQVRRHR